MMTDDPVYSNELKKFVLLTYSKSRADIKVDLKNQKVDLKWASLRLLVGWNLGDLSFEMSIKIDFNALSEAYSSLECAIAGIRIGENQQIMEDMFTKNIIEIIPLCEVFSGNPTDYMAIAEIVGRKNYKVAKTKYGI